MEANTCNKIIIRKQNNRIADNMESTQQEAGRMAALPLPRSTYACVANVAKLNLCPRNNPLVTRYVDQGLKLLEAKAVLKFEI